MLPLTATLPKGMLPIGGKPLLEHLVGRAKEAGAERLVIVVGHQRETIVDAFGDGSRLDVKIEYAFQEEGLGTGPALLAAEALAEDRFLVLRGDVLPDAAYLKRLMALEAPALAVARVEGPRPDRDWILEVGEGRLRSISHEGKAPLSNLVSAGIFLLDERAFEALRRVPIGGGGERDILAAVRVLLADGVLVGAEVVERWIEIVFPWDILRANETLMPPETRGVLGEVEANASLSGEVAVGRGTAIRSGSYVAGPVVIGEGCAIGPNCLIRGTTSIGDGVRIGNGVVIEGSTIMDGTEVLPPLLRRRQPHRTGMQPRRRDHHRQPSPRRLADPIFLRRSGGRDRPEGLRGGPRRGGEDRGWDDRLPRNGDRGGALGTAGRSPLGARRAEKIEEEREDGEKVEAEDGDLADCPGAGALRTKRGQEGRFCRRRCPESREGMRVKRKNRLAFEKSPYLLEHANNPVDWHPWGRRRSAGLRGRTSRYSYRSATPPATGATSWPPSPSRTRRWRGF